MSPSKYINHGKLGGTAACILAHGNHFGNTPMTLWEEMVGQKKPENLDWKLPVQIGIATEDTNMAFLGNKSGYDIFPGDKPVNDMLDRYDGFVRSEHKTKAGKIPLFTSTKFDWAVAQVDGFCRKPGEEAIRLVEAKHSNGFGSMEKSYETYYPQVQHYLGVFGFTHGALSCIFDNNRHEFMWIRRDDVYIKELWKKMAQFWRFVQTEQPPVKTTGVSKKVLPVKTVDLTQSNSWAAAEADYLDNKDAAEKHEASKKSLKALAPANAVRTFGKMVEIRRAKNGNASIKPIQQEK